MESVFTLATAAALQYPRRETEPDTFAKKPSPEKISAFELLTVTKGHLTLRWVDLPGSFVMTGQKEEMVLCHLHCCIFTVVFPVWKLIGRRCKIDHGYQWGRSLSSATDSCHGFPLSHLAIFFCYQSAPKTVSTIGLRSSQGNPSCYRSIFFLGTKKKVCFPTLIFGDNHLLPWIPLMCHTAAIKGLQEPWNCGKIQHIMWLRETNDIRDQKFKRQFIENIGPKIYF